MEKKEQEIVVAQESRADKRKKNLSLRKEMLRELKSEQLENVAGAGTYSTCCGASTNFAT